MRLVLKCNLCSAVFELTTQELVAEQHLHACDKCGAACQIRRLSVSAEPSEPAHFEFHGCSSIAISLDEPSLSGLEPSSKMVDSARTVLEEVDQTLEESVMPLPLVAPVAGDTMLSWIKEEAESREEAALAGTLSEWKVHLANGQMFQFHFLTALRKWIMDGRIQVGDKLETSGGARYQVEEYPGTADLFANLELMKARRRQVLRAKKWKKTRQRLSWRQLRRRHFELGLLAAVMVVALVIAGRIGWQRYEFQRSAKKGEQYLYGLGRLDLEVPANADQEILTRLVWTGADSSVTKAVEYLTGRLSRAVTRGANGLRDALGDTSLLAEALARRAVMSGSAADLSLARHLLDWVKQGHPGLAARLRAEATFSWVSGGNADARQFLQEYLRRVHDPYGYYLLALLYEEMGDLSAAKRQLYQAAELTPGNSLFPAAMAKLLEKEQKWPEAIAVLEGVLEREPGNAELLKRLGACYERNGELEEAEKTYQRGLQLSERPEEFQYLLVVFYKMQNRLHDTIRAAGYYLGNFPEGDHLRLVQQYSDQAQQTLAEQKVQELRETKRQEEKAANSRRRLWIRR